MYLKTQIQATEEGMTVTAAYSSLLLHSSTQQKQGALLL